MPFAAASNVCVCGRYTLLAKLGAGGQGEVWRARDHEQGIEIALKILSPELARSAGAWEALQREYTLASRLDHPLILKVYRPERDADVAALPMELAPGGDLRRLRTVSYLEIGPVLLEVAQALAHTHARGIVHRDLKPGNVLFDSRGHVRLADFGIAGTVLGAVPATGEPARAGASPFTASPEQLRGGPPSVADDIYGLGALAYELLSGYPPYYPRFELKRVMEEPVPELKPAHQAPGRLIALVMAMLAKHAEERPASMQEVIDSLETALNDTLTFFEEAAEPTGLEAPKIHPALVVHNPTIVDTEVVALPEPRRAQRMPAPGELPRQPQIADPGRASKPAEIIDPAPVPAPTPVPVPTTASGPDPEPHLQRVSKLGTVSGPPSAKLAPASELSAVSKSAPVSNPAPISKPAPAAASQGPSIAGPIPPPAPMKAARAEKPGEQDLRELWADIKVERMPHPRRVEPERRSRWPWVLIGTLAAVAAVSFFWLPHWAGASRSWAPSSLASVERLMPQGMVEAVKSFVDPPPRVRSAAGRSDQPPSAADADSPVPAAATESSVSAARTHVEAQLAALDARGAGIWAGQAYADAKAREAEAVGADEAGSPSMAAQKLAAAERLLGQVLRAAPAAFAAQLSQGEQALQAGNAAVADQAFHVAQQIDPSDSRAADGLRRAQALDGDLPLLVDGLNAEAARNYSRAVQDYRHLLSLDPGDAKAHAGLQRATAGLEAQRYARAVGGGLESLADGRLQAAQAAFELAYSLNHRSRQAVDGLQRVSTAMRARKLTQLESRATALEAQQRWSEALQQYDAALQLDPSLAAAQQGKARVAARLSMLVPADAKTVHLTLVSDNETEVEIPQIGMFGTFSRREIDLKPGNYTVIGTRAGYKDVIRDVTIAPGQDVQTISVSCEEPI